jgi:hypothetical protein
MGSLSCVKLKLMRFAMRFTLAQFAHETAKLTRKIGSVCTLTAMIVCWARAQQTPGSPPQELPVLMRQAVVAGQTPVGAKVEAKLSIATLVSGKVIPAGATLSGEVVVSEAKTADKPSRLAIRVDSARWKNNSLPFNAYLTAWYYPQQIAMDDNSASNRTGIHGEAGVGAGVGIGGARSAAPMSRPYPPNNPNDAPNYPAPPASTLSASRVKMKDVDSVPLEGGGIAIASSRLNLKLDKSTTYVLATGDLTKTK